MSAEENKALAHRLFEALYNQHDVASIDAYLAPDFVNNTAVPGVPPGREGVKQFFALVFAAFPDAHYTLDDLLADGEKVVLRWTFTGTHQGEFAGVAPTGKRVTAGGIEISRIVDGKLTEVWDQVDMLGLLQQLGALPTP